MKKCKCKECGIDLPIKNTIRVDSDRYCSDCYTIFFDSKLISCDECGSMVSESDILYQGSMAICSDCYELQY